MVVDVASGAEVGVGFSLAPPPQAASTRTPAIVNDNPKGNLKLQRIMVSLPLLSSGNYVSVSSNRPKPNAWRRAPCHSEAVASHPNIAPPVKQAMEAQASMRLCASPFPELRNSAMQGGATGLTPRMCAPTMARQTEAVKRTVDSVLGLI